MAIPRSFRDLVLRFRPSLTGVVPLTQALLLNEEQENQDGHSGGGDTQGRNCCSNESAVQEEEEVEEGEMKQDLEDMTMEIKLPGTDTRDVDNHHDSTMPIHRSIVPTTRKLSSVDPSFPARSSMIPSFSITSISPSSLISTTVPLPSDTTKTTHRPRPFRRSFSLLRLSFGSPTSTSASPSITPPSASPALSPNTLRVHESSTPPLSCCSKEVAEDPFARVAPSTVLRSTTSRSTSSSSKTPKKCASPRKLRNTPFTDHENITMKKGRPSTAPSSTSNSPARNGWLEALSNPLPFTNHLSSIQSEERSIPLVVQKRNQIKVSQKEPLQPPFEDEMANEPKDCDPSIIDPVSPMHNSRPPVAPLAIPGVSIPTSSTFCAGASSPISSYGTVPSLTMSTSISSVSSISTYFSDATKETIVTGSDSSESRVCQNQALEMKKNASRVTRRKNTLEEAFAILDELYDSTAQVLSAPNTVSSPLQKPSDLVSPGQSSSKPESSGIARLSQVSLLDPMCPLNFKPCNNNTTDTILEKNQVRTSSSTTGSTERSKGLRSLPTLQDQRMPLPLALLSAYPENVTIHNAGVNTEADLFRIVSLPDKRIDSSKKRPLSPAVNDAIDLHEVERENSIVNSKPAHEFSRFIEDLESALDDTTSLAYLQYFGRDAPPSGLFDDSDWLAKHTLPASSPRVPVCKRAATSPPALAVSEVAPRSLLYSQLEAQQTYQTPSRNAMDLPTPPVRTSSLSTQDAQYLSHDSERTKGLLTRPSILEYSRFSFSSAESAPTSRSRSSLHGKVFSKARPSTSTCGNNADSHYVSRWFSEPPADRPLHTAFGNLRPVRGVFKRQASLPSSTFGGRLQRRRAISGFGAADLS